MTNENERIERYEIENFIDNDYSQILLILVLNSENECEIRHSLNNNINLLLEADDKKLIAVSKKNYDYNTDICDDCEYEALDEKTDTYYCNENCNKLDCAVEAILYSDINYCEAIFTDFKHNLELQK